MLMKSSAVVALLALAAVPAVGQAPQTAPAQAQTAPVVPVFGPVRLGFINLERALGEVQEGKALFGELQGYIEKKNLELKNRQDEISRKQEQLRTQERTLSEETRSELQKDIDEKRTALSRFQEDTAKDIERRQNVNVQRIGQKMQPLMQTYAKEKNLTAIVIWSPQLYAYVDETVNVTDDIIKRYDAAYPYQPPSPPVKPKNP